MAGEMRDLAGLLGAALLASGAVATDVKRGRISRMWLLLNLIPAAFYAALTGPGLMGFAGALPGLAMLLSSAVFKGAVGMEDACLAAAGGIYLGLMGSLEVLFFGFLLCSAAGIAACAVKGKRKGRRILFSPFYAAGLALFFGGGHV